MRLAVLVVAALLLVPASASACPSRSASGLRDKLAGADAAFVGKRARHHARRYILQTRVKGELGPRVRVYGLRGCGVPRRTGLLLERRDGRWWATRAVEPGALLKTAGIGP